MARLSVAPETRVTISAKWKLLMKTRPIGRRTAKPLRPRYGSTLSLVSLPKDNGQFTSRSASASGFSSASQGCSTRSWMPTSATSERYASTGSAASISASITRPVRSGATVTMAVPPFTREPNSTMSARGFLMCSWMTRSMGRAPIVAS